MSQDSGYSAPRGGGRPWWPWVLGGCGGCLLLVIIGIVGFGAWVTSVVRNVKVGPVTQQSVKQSLGNVPLYPNGTLDLRATEAAIRGQAVGKAFTPGAQRVTWRGVAAVRTSDSADQVIAYYDRELPKGGWASRQTTSMGGLLQQRIYQKGQELLVVQVQSIGGQRQVTLMRGESAAAPGRQRSPSAAPAPGQ
jgi:hypothetical protein